MTTDAIQCGGWAWRGIVPWDKKNGRPTAAGSAVSVSIEAGYRFIGIELTETYNAVAIERLREASACAAG